MTKEKVLLSSPSMTPPVPAAAEPVGAEAPIDVDTPSGKVNC